VPGIFISYSHRDEKFLDQFRTHLKPLERIAVLDAWSDKQIVPGSEWFEDIKKALSRARVAVLLVTPNFLASDFIHDQELTPLLRKAGAGGVKILWIIIQS
jgi:internalin A